MDRRKLLRLGLVSAAVLAVAGGGLLMVQPGLQQGRLGSAAREVFRSVGAAVLDGSLPATEPARTGALDGMLERLDALMQALPPHTQAELSQLLALLGTSAGRRLVAGLSQPWAEASIPELQQALQSMRVARLSLRQQAYHALHDLVGGAYFSEPSTWTQIGYPGPRPV